MRYLFDTKALIAFFNNEDGAEFVEKLLKEVDEGKAEGFISSITLMEIYSNPSVSGVIHEAIRQIRGNEIQDELYLGRG